MRWTKAYRKLAGKELAQDTTFELERRRNRPERYNRELLCKTMKGMKTITEIRKKRQDRFYDIRTQNVQNEKLQEQKQQLLKEIHLVKAPQALLKNAQDEQLVEKIVAEPVAMREEMDTQEWEAECERVFSHHVL